MSGSKCSSLEQLDKIEDNIDRADVNMDKAQVQTARFTMNPCLACLSGCFTSRKTKELRKQAEKAADREREEALLQRRQEKATEREQVRAAATAAGTSARAQAEGRAPAAPLSQREEMEMRVDKNLDTIQGSVRNLKNISQTMNREVVAQNEQLDRMADKVDKVNNKVTDTNRTINKYL